MEGFVDLAIRRWVRHDALSELRSEQPGQELAGEECKATPENDSGDLPLRPLLGKHEEQSADDDGHKGERSRQRAGERPLEIAGRALPRRLRESGLWQCNQEERQEDELRAFDERLHRALDSRLLRAT